MADAVGDEGSRTATIYFTEADLHPDVVALQSVGILVHLASTGDFNGLRGFIDLFEKIEPGTWETTGGRLCLRLTTIKAIEHPNLSIVQYLCGEWGVPPLAEDPDAYELAERRNMFREIKPNMEPNWLPLKLAVALGRTEIVLYLLGLVSAEDLGRTFPGGTNLLHYAAQTGDMSLFESLVQRGVEFDVRSKFGITPLDFAIQTSRMAVLRFLLQQYHARGRDEQKVLWDLVNRPRVSRAGKPEPLITSILDNSSIPDEDKRAMVAFLVQEAGLNVWAEMPRSKDGYPLPHLPLHTAAALGNRPVVDFFLKECGMSIDTCTFDQKLTPLMYAVMLCFDETADFPIVTWLVDELGADVTRRNEAGYTVARMAHMKGKMRMYHFLKSHEERQAAQKESDKIKQDEKEKAAPAKAAKEKEKQEEESKKAAARRMQEAEEGMAALLLELEAEEEAEKQAAVAAGGSKKKKASGGGKKKKK